MGALKTVLAGAAAGTQARKDRELFERNDRIKGLRSQVSGQIDDGSFTTSSRAFNNLMLEDPHIATMAETFAKVPRQRKKDYFEMLQAIQPMVASGDRQGAMSYLDQRLANIAKYNASGQNMPVDDSMSRMLKNKLETDSDEDLKAGFKMSIQAARDSGLLPKADEKTNAKAQQLEAYEKVLATGNKEDIANFEKVYGLNKSDIDKDFYKEERKYASDVVKQVNKRGGEIRSSYGKIEGILKGKTLNRMAITSAMTSMARLISPGIVTDNDLRGMSNTVDPFVQVLEIIQGKDIDAAKRFEEVSRFYDPANPELFDREGFLGVAKAVVGAEIPSILDDYNEAKERATTAGISQRAWDTNFKNNKTINFLQGMLSPQPTNQDSANAPEGTTATHPDGRKMVVKNGQWVKA